MLVLNVELNLWLVRNPPRKKQKTKKTLLHWLTLPAESGDKVYSVSECVYPDERPESYNISCFLSRPPLWPIWE